MLIISGGQTGADRGALIAAKIKGVETKGYAPKNYRTEDGSDPTLRDFGLIEINEDSLKVKDMKNVEMCNILIAFRYNVVNTGKGTDSTVNYALTGKYEYVPNIFEGKLVQVKLSQNNARKVLIVWNLDKDNIKEISELILQHIKHEENPYIMVSGPCESTFGSSFSVQALVSSLFLSIIDKIN